MGTMEIMLCSCSEKKIDPPCRPYLTSVSIPSYRVPQYNSMGFQDELHYSAMYFNSSMKHLFLNLLCNKSHIKSPVNTVEERRRNAGRNITETAGYLSFFCFMLGW